MAKDKKPEADTLDSLKPFATPITIAEVNYTHFEMREPTVIDMFDAENAVANFGGGAQATPLQFNGEMMVLQLNKVTNDSGGEFKGPFTINMLKQWGPKNYRTLRARQYELDLLGEDLESEEDPS